MRTSPKALALNVFRRLPVWMRRAVVRVIAPSYAVGSVVVIRNQAGALLLLRERHHDGWGLPGGLLARRELTDQAAVRELREEIGVYVDADRLGLPSVAVDPLARRVDVIYAVAVDDSFVVSAHEPEVLEARWFPLDALPELFEPSLAVLQTIGLVKTHDPR